MWLLMTLLGMMAAAQMLRLQRQLQCSEQLWRSGSGLLSVELRRRARVTRLADDLQEFPQPREFRVLAMRLAGLPLWQRECFVSLPQHFDVRIDQVRAEEFDGAFDASFRLGSPLAAARLIDPRAVSAAFRLALVRSRH
jgi:hypothetical protein